MQYPVRFGADGIRAIAGEWPLDDFGVARIASALGRFAGKRSDHPVVIVGRDTRPSGGWLVNSMEAGLLAGGVDVISLGVMTTPGVAYLTRRLGAVLGVSVSASHNPVEYNGIKLVGFNGLRLQREDEMEIEGLIERAESDQAEHSVVSTGSMGQQTNAQHLIEFYIRDHMQRCPASSLAGLRLVLDCANGAAARVAPHVFTGLGAEITVLNDDAAGGCINHGCGSEHVRWHPQDLVAAVRRQNASYGLAFDGDGDRLVAVDSDGCLFDGDDVLFSLATHFHGQSLLRGNAVVATDAANSGLEKALNEAGIRVVRAGKGDRALEAAMWYGDYLVGGEPTGNIIVNDGYHTAADAVYTALLLAGILHDQGVSLADMAVTFQKHPQVLASVLLGTTAPLAQLADLRMQAEELQARLGEGTRAATWYSSTEPGVFKVMVEGGPGSRMDEVREAAVSMCRTVLQIVDSVDAEIRLLELSERRPA